MRWNAGLAPIGLLVAFAAVHHPALVVIVLPLVGLLALFAREREQRIDAALELAGRARQVRLTREHADLSVVNGRPIMPDVPEYLLTILTGGNGLYLAGKISRRT